MNLWVRSQDKTIFQKVDNLLISDGNNAEGTFNIYTNSLPAQNVLGTYKTKERAIEVLDEIEKLIKPTIITTGYECELKENIKDKTSFNLDMIPTKTEIQELSTVVYQMPEN